MKDENAPNKGGIEPTFFRFDYLNDYYDNDDLGITMIIMTIFRLILKMTFGCKHFIVGKKYIFNCSESQAVARRGRDCILKQKLKLSQGKKYHLKITPTVQNITESSNWSIINRPEIAWYLGTQLLAESEKYSFYRAIQVTFDF